jgi:hypothetical protein
LLDELPVRSVRTAWTNVGGQLILQTELQKLTQQIHSGKINDWEKVHQFYRIQGQRYVQDKLQHALVALKEVQGIHAKKMDKAVFKNLLQQSIATKEWMVKGIYDSRAKDYRNPFRKMVYETQKEMNAVVGALADNSFINQEIESLSRYKKEVNGLIRKFKL